MPGQQHSDTPTTLGQVSCRGGSLGENALAKNQQTITNFKLESTFFVIPRFKFRLCIKIRLPNISRIFNASCLQEGVGAGTRRACTNNAPVQASASTNTCTSPPPREGGLVQVHVLATTPRSKHTCLHPCGPPAQAHICLHQCPGASTHACANTCVQEHHVLAPPRCKHTRWHRNPDASTHAGTQPNPGASTHACTQTPVQAHPLAPKP